MASKRSLAIKEQQARESRNDFYSRMEILLTAIAEKVGVDLNELFPTELEDVVSEEVVEDTAEADVEEEAEEDSNEEDEDVSDGGPEESEE